MKLRDLASRLEAGETPRFRYPGTGRTAVLLEIGPMAARIQYDEGSTLVKVESKKTGETVEFNRPARVELVSDYSDIELL